MAPDRANVNINGFINEVESWPAIWDLRHDDYSNKNAKRNEWEAVTGQIVPDFNDRLRKKSLASKQLSW